MQIKFKNYKKLLTILFVSVCVLFFIAEGLWLCIVPSLIENKMNEKCSFTETQNTTELQLKYKKFKIKTTPLFNLSLDMEQLSLTDIQTNEQKVAIESINTEIKILELLRKNISLKNFNVKNALIKIDKHKDGSLYIGNYELPKYKNIENINLKQIDGKILNSQIQFSEFESKNYAKLNIDSLYIKKFNPQKSIDFELDANTIHNNNKSRIKIKLDSASPLKNCFYDANTVFYAQIKHLDLSLFNIIAQQLPKSDIEKITGQIDLEIKNKKNIIAAKQTQKINSSKETPFNPNFSRNKNLELSTLMTIDKLSIETNENYGHIKSNKPIRVETDIAITPKVFNIISSKIDSNDININANGYVTNYKKQNPTLNLDVKINETDINTIYWLIPSIKNDEQQTIQKFKKYGVWGTANGHIKIKDNLKTPQIIGKVEIKDVHILKHNPNIEKCKILLDFIENKVKIITRIHTGKDQYVDVNGIAETKLDGNGDFDINSSQKVDIKTAMELLLPIQDVIGFEIGPLAQIQLTGYGNITLKTTGTIKKGIAFGKLNFYEATAKVKDINTRLENANGNITFEKRNININIDKSYIGKALTKIKGNANIDGDIELNIRANNLNTQNIVELINTSPFLKDKKYIIKQIERIDGNAEIDINTKGNFRECSVALDKNNLHQSGIIKIKNNIVHLKNTNLSATKVQSTINFDDEDWSIKGNGIVDDGQIIFDGTSKKGKNKFKFDTKNVNLDKLIPSLTNNSISNIKTNALITMHGLYSSNNKELNLNDIIADGYITNKDKSTQNDIQIEKITYKLKKGDLQIDEFNANIYGAQVFLTGNISNVFGKTPTLNYKLLAENFNLKKLNEIKKHNILPAYLQNLIDTYENYQGNANAVISCKNNSLDGKIDIKDVSFNHAYYKTLTTISSGDILLNENKIFIKSLIAEIDKTPIYIDAAVWDLDKTAKFKGYFTTKLTENFTNEYVNTKLKYPLNPKGDITITANISGDANHFLIKPKLRLEEDADIYYMGANIGDEQTPREIVGEIEIHNNTYIIKNAQYIRYIFSQNDKPHPLPILQAKGIIDLSNKNINNLKIETINSTNAKLFNTIFKKSIIKNGMFDCKLNIAGNMSNPKVIGQINFNNIEMPFYNTFVKNLAINIKNKTITTFAEGNAYNTDFSIKSELENKTQLPYVVKNIEIESKLINLDELINSLTNIPTPDTTKKMSDITNRKKSFDISSLRILDGQITAENVIIKKQPAKNFYSKFKFQDDMILTLEDINIDLTNGKVKGNASHNFNNNRIKADLIATNVDSNTIASALFDIKDQIFGVANGNLIMTTQGTTEQERIKNLNGYVYFDIKDGKMPKLGSVEYLLKAGNFIKSGLTGASISNFVDLIAPIKTGYFTSIKGKMTLKNGVAQGIEIYSKGEKLNLFINGEYDILNQYANLKIYGRLTKTATNLLGKIGNLSFNSFINTIPGMKIGYSEKAKLINDLNKIPGVELSDKQYRIFNAKIDGNINNENYVRSFKWIE